MSESRISADIIIDKTESVRKISTWREKGEIKVSGLYQLDVHCAEATHLTGGVLRKLTVIFNHKAPKEDAVELEERISDSAEVVHHTFAVHTNQPVRWSLEVKSGTLARSIPVKVLLQRISDADDLPEAEPPVLSPREVLAPPATDARLSVSEENLAPAEFIQKEVEKFEEEEDNVDYSDAVDGEDSLTDVPVTYKVEEEEVIVDPVEAQATPEDVKLHEILWKDEVRLKRGMEEEQQTLLTTGHYRLVLQKVDNLMGPKRIIACTVIMERQVDGSIVKQYTREVGGIVLGSKLTIDFRIKEKDSPVVFKLQTATNAAARIVPVRLRAFILSRSADEGPDEKLMQDDLSHRPFKRMAQKRATYTNMNSQDSMKDTNAAGEVTKKKKSVNKLLMEAKSVDVLGTRTWHLVLEEGYYMVGVVNVSQTKAGGDQEESEPLAQGTLPWKAYFHVSAAQQPAKLTITATSHIRGIATGVRTTVKVKKVPNPFSYDEIIRKSARIRHIAVAVLGALLALSFGMQLIQFIFSICIPFVGISFRSIFTVGALAYAFYYRVELREFLREKMIEGQETLQWLLALDSGSNNSIQKLKLLMARQNKKKELERKRIEQLRDI